MPQRSSVSRISGEGERTRSGRSLQSRRFRSAIEDRDAAESARRADCRIRIRGNGDIRLESVQAHLVGNLFGNLRIRSEQTLQSFDIEDDGSIRRVFHAR